ncbi:MAG TPA: helix-turn-helix transcriptional regulator [Kofleriaceae bacterium]
MAKAKAAAVQAAEAAVQLQLQLGQRIQGLRAKHELTQEALAAKMGISQKYVSELERGTKSPSWQTLVALAHQGFDTNLASLMFGVDDEVASEAGSLDALLAGRSREARADLLRAFELILRAAGK